MSRLRINGELATKAQIAAAAKKSKAMEARKRALEKQRIERGWTVRHDPVRFGEVDMFGDGHPTKEVWVPPAPKPRQKKAKAKESRAKPDSEPMMDFYGEK